MSAGGLFSADVYPSIMKSIVIILNGVADEAVAALSGRTPLDVNRAQNASKIAASGQAGLLNLADLPAGSGHRLLAELLGLPADVSGSLQRGPLWAASLDEDLSRFDFAYCANFVTLDEEGVLTGSRVKNLSFGETCSLTEEVQASLPDSVAIRAVGPAQAVLLCRAEMTDSRPGEAPIFKMGTRASKYLAGFKKKSQAVADWMNGSIAALEGHPVNEVRVDLNENPANFLWLWDGGPLTGLDRSVESGAMLTNSPTAAGLAKSLGMPVLSLTDPWTMEAAAPAFSLPDVVQMLRMKNQLFIFVEAPGCLGTFGSLPEKLRMLEAADQRLLQPLAPILEANRPYRVSVLSDSVVSTEAGVPVKGSVPLVVAGEGISCDEIARWSERDCAGGSLGIINRATLRHMIGS
jgi:2,3-bisphosphoglycerate-independent phosphoglycerate mutase